MGAGEVEGGGDSGGVALAPLPRAFYIRQPRTQTNEPPRHGKPTLTAEEQELFKPEYD